MLGRAVHPFAPASGDVSSHAKHLTTTFMLLIFSTDAQLKYNVKYANINTKV